LSKETQKGVFDIFRKFTKIYGINSSNLPKIKESIPRFYQKRGLPPLFEITLHNDYKGLRWGEGGERFYLMLIPFFINKLPYRV